MLRSKGVRNEMVYCYFVGPFKDKRCEEMAGDYLRRLEKLWPVTLLELSTKSKELLKKIESKVGRGVLVSLDAHGERMDSRAFIQWVTQSSKDLHFFVWDADGPPPEIQKLGLKSLSLSPMTYPHDLARVLLMEQLYRAGATLKGHPYPR
jgi:23S rRNA (pseudouridine1915-N3)-methyltransferase